jgi:hypothetical protein
MRNCMPIDAEMTTTQFCVEVGLPLLVIVASVVVSTVSLMRLRRDINELRMDLHELLADSNRHVPEL